MPPNHPLLLILRMTGHVTAVAIAAALFFGQLIAFPDFTIGNTPFALLIVLVSGMMFGMIVGPVAALLILWIAGSAPGDMPASRQKHGMVAIAALGTLLVFGFGRAIGDTEPSYLVFAQQVLLVVGTLLVGLTVSRKFIRNLTPGKRKGKR